MHKYTLCVQILSLLELSLCTTQYNGTTNYNLKTDQQVEPTKTVNKKLTLTFSKVGVTAGLLF